MFLSSFFSSALSFSLSHGPSLSLSCSTRCGSRIPCILLQGRRLARAHLDAAPSRRPRPATRLALDEPEPEKIVDVVLVNVDRHLLVDLDPAVRPCSSFSRVDADAAERRDMERKRARSLRGRHRVAAAALRRPASSSTAPESEPEDPLADRARRTGPRARPAAAAAPGPRLVASSARRTDPQAARAARAPCAAERARPRAALLLRHVRRERHVGRRRRVLAQDQGARREGREEGEGVARREEPPGGVGRAGVEEVVERRGCERPTA